METVENWQIRYNMQLREQIVSLDETLLVRRGYHDALNKFWAENEFKESEKDPIYKTRDRNYVELLSLGFAGGFTLPLTPRRDLEGAVLLLDCEHPIILTAPDETKYKHCE